MELGCVRRELSQALDEVQQEQVLTLRLQKHIQQFQQAPDQAVYECAW